MPLKYSFISSDQRFYSPVKQQMVQKSKTAKLEKVLIFVISCQCFLRLNINMRSWEPITYDSDLLEYFNSKITFLRKNTCLPIPYQNNQLNQRLERSVHSFRCFILEISQTTGTPSIMGGRIQ